VFCGIRSIESPGGQNSENFFFSHAGSSWFGRHHSYLLASCLSHRTLQCRPCIRPRTSQVGTDTRPGPRNAVPLFHRKAWRGSSHVEAAGGHDYPVHDPSANEKPRRSGECPCDGSQGACSSAGGVARTWGGTSLWYGDHGRVDCFLTSTVTRLAAGTPPRPRSVLSSLAGTHESTQS
jgi:hypothetical protein